MASISSDIARQDAVGTAALIRDGHMSATEVVEAAIDRIEAIDPVINMMAARTFDTALAAAKSPPRGVFAGVPTLIKDDTDYAGARMAFGSRSRADTISTETAPYVAAMERSGLIILGKSTVPEFTLIPTTEALLTGLTRNPWNLGRSTSGSSGGAAAAVAAGLVPIAHATDGGGSIRLPASACGLFGLKAGNGRLFGAAGKAASGGPFLVHGCVSRSVRDAATLLAATERTDADMLWPPVGPVSGPSSRRLRIAFSTIDIYGRDAEPDVRDAIEETARLCESLGHRIDPVRPPISSEEFTSHFMTLFGLSAAMPVNAWIAGSGRAPDDSIMEPFTLALADHYARLPASATEAALAYFQKLEDAMDDFLADFDMMLTPVTRTVVPPLGYLSPQGPLDLIADRVRAYASYTPVQNIASQPAMSVPLGWTKDGIPVGSHFAVRMGGERLLLELAFELEAARPWADRWPPCAA